MEDLCYGASGARKADKTITQNKEKEAEICRKIKKGVTNPAQQQNLEKELGKLRTDRAKAEAKLRQIHQTWEASGNPLLDMFSPVGIQLPQAPQQPQQLPVSTPQQPVTIKLRTDDKRYGKFQQKEKELILAIYNVIEQTLNNEKERDALIDKIEREITK